MTLVSDAMIFAACAHDGMLRKGTNVPYIVHPAEVAAIASTLTDDPEILAAAVLHDVIEDCGVSWQELAQRFGARVAELVLSETQERCGDPRMTWEARKRAAIVHIGADIAFAADHGVNPGLFRSRVEIHRAVHHAVIGHGAVAHALRAQRVHQRIDAARAVKQAVFRMQMKMSKINHMESIAR